METFVHYVCSCILYYNCVAQIIIFTLSGAFISNPGVVVANNFKYFKI